jgi:hypothetical protein
MMSDNTKATERKCSVTVAVGKVFCLLTLNFCLVLSHLRRLPDGAQVIESKRRNVFGHFKFLKKGEIVEMYENFLLNDRSSAAIAGAKRRTVVAIAVVMMGCSSQFSLCCMTLQWLIDARQRREENDVNG